MKHIQMQVFRKRLRIFRNDCNRGEEWDSPVSAGKIQLWACAVRVMPCSEPIQCKGRV